MLEGRKVISYQLVRDITGKQFVDGLEDSLLPQLHGKCAAELAQMKSAFAKTSLKKNTKFVVSLDGAILFALILAYKIFASNIDLFQITDLKYNYLWALLYYVRDFVENNYGG